MRKDEQYPLLDWNTQECAELRRLSWRFYGLRWVFWTLQLLVVITAWWISAEMWDGQQKRFNRVHSVEFLMVFLILMNVWLQIKSRIAIDRHLQALVIELWQRQEPKPGLFAPWSLDDHVDTNIISVIFIVLLMIVDAVVFLLGFNSMFFGDEYNRLAWSLGILFAIGAVADWWFDDLVSKLKTQSRAAYQSVRRRRYNSA